VTSNSTFVNANGATLALGSAAIYGITAPLTNNGALTMANGSVLFPPLRPLTPVL